MSTPLKLYYKRHQVVAVNDAKANLIRRLKNAYLDGPKEDNKDGLGHDGWQTREDRATVEAELIANDKVCATCRGTFVAVQEGHPTYYRW